MKPIIVAAAGRTPVGRFGGTLAGLSARSSLPLPSRKILQCAQVKPGQLDELFMGRFLSAGPIDP